MHGWKEFATIPLQGANYWFVSVVLIIIPFFIHFLRQMTDKRSHACSEMKCSFKVEILRSKDHVTIRRKETLTLDQTEGGFRTVYELLKNIFETRNDDAKCFGIRNVIDVIVEKGKNGETLKKLQLENQYLWMTLSKFRSNVETIGQNLRKLGLNPLDKLAIMDDTGIDWFTTACACIMHNITETVPSSPDDICVLMYTSGSTGRPKGVLFQHSNLVSAFKILAKEVDVNEQDIYMAYLPLAHIMELTGEFLFFNAGIRVGYANPATLQTRSPRLSILSKGDLCVLHPTVILCVPVSNKKRLIFTERFQYLLEKFLNGIWSEVKTLNVLHRTVFSLLLSLRTKFWNFNLIPSIFDALMFKNFRKMFGGKLRFIICGSAPLSTDTNKALQTILGIPIKIGYGLTESCCGGTFCHDRRHLDTVGVPISHVQVRLANWEEGGYTVSDQINPRGEICIGGPMISIGYYKNELMNECFFTEDGVRWVMTGDIGEINSSRCLKIIDRKKDLVKLSNGEYIPLGKVESSLMTDPLIDNICVCANSYKARLAALVIVNKLQMRNVARKLGKNKLTYEKLCADPAVVSEVLRVIQEIGRLQHLKDIEIPAAIKLCPEEWNSLNGLLTPTFKLRRKQIENRYYSDINQLYQKLPA